MSHLFSYTMMADTGFAPHVDNGCAYLTLACCKPEIRNSAQKDDWVMGSGGQLLGQRAGKDMNQRLVWVGRVSQYLDFDSYYSNPVFKGRIDNIYRSENGNGKRWVQRRNPYHDENNIGRDTKHNRVLVFERFLYLGASGPKLVEFSGEHLGLFKKGPGHKKFNLQTNEIARKFIQDLEKRFKFNLCSPPTEEEPSEPCNECD